MYDTPQELIQGLRDGATIISALARGYSQAEAQSTREEGGWSVLEIVCHLRDGDERGIERMRAMRDEDEPAIVPFDQDAWVVERNYAADDLQAALAAFLRFRAQYIAELEALPADAWERAGYHEELGRITISSHTLHRLCHDLGHAAQLARLLRWSA